MVVVKSMAGTQTGPSGGLTPDYEVLLDIQSSTDGQTVGAYRRHFERPTVKALATPSTEKGTKILLWD